MSASFLKVPSDERVNNGGKSDVEMKVVGVENGLAADKDEDGGGDGDDRQEWENPLQFFFTLLGFCVGLGNIWRFPYLCQANGGGAFIIPFFVMYVLEGMPLLLLELGIGQRLRKGSYGVWNMIHPSLGGIGLGSTVIATIVGCYYNVIIAWCFYYLIRSMTLTLPWSYCPLIEVGNSSEVLDPECLGSSESKYFWYREALDISGSITDIGGIKWWMLLCLITAWLVVYFIIMKGVQASGKVVYFTALFPYVVMTIFFIRGLTLKGATAGLAHMFYPQMDKLLSPSVWLDAANMVFYSYGIALGSFIGFGSYNPKKKNCVFDVFAISACNAMTALYAGAVVFVILGFKAQQLFDKCKVNDLDILTQLESYNYLNASEVSDDEYRALMMSSQLQASGVAGLKNCSLEAELNNAGQGTGLAFIVMADVFTMMPGSPFWSFLFFAMLLALGLGSVIGIMEGVLGTLFDVPQLANVKKPILSGAACLFCFTVGLLFITDAGEYWLALFDKYGAMGLTLIALVEVIVVMYVYGHEKFTQDIFEMTGIRPGLYWQLTWRFISPALLTAVLLTSIITEFMKTQMYSAWNAETATSVNKEYPSFCLAFAIFLAIASILPILAVFLLRLVKKDGAVSSNGKCTRKVLEVDTSPSSKPMLPNEHALQDHDENDGVDNRNVS